MTTPKRRNTYWNELLQHVGGMSLLIIAFVVVFCGLVLASESAPLLLVTNNRGEDDSKRYQAPAWLLEKQKALDDESIAMPAGEHHKALRLFADYPGINDPWIVDGHESGFEDETKIVGIVVEGQAYAFPRELLLDPTRHIVNLTLANKPISVTYCDLVDCVRVFTDDKQSAPIDLHVGGLDVDNQMVLLFEGKRYGQSVEEIPLKDYPFEYTTLGERKRLHLETKIYEGAAEDRNHAPNALTWN